jgi:8-oxo-dGTP diphosphatase
MSDIFIRHGFQYGRWTGQSGRWTGHSEVYTVGFVFNETRTHVRLIRKKRPAWQAGLYNGIGGHVEPDETLLECMVREYREEAGILTLGEQWNCFAVMSGKHYADGGAFVYCYEMANDSVHYSSLTCTDEAVVALPVISCHLDPHLFLPSLPILIPLALNRDTFWRPVSLVWPDAAPRGDGDGFNHTRQSSYPSLSPA